MMKSKIFTLIKFFLGWPLSFAALFFLIKTFSPKIHEIQGAVVRGNLLILLFAFIFFFLYFLFRVLLWKKILLSWGHEVPFFQTAWYWSLSEINRYVPGNIWSILGRGVTFSKFGISKSTLFIAWVAESLLVIIGSLTVSILGLTLFFFHTLPPFPFREILFWATYASIIILDLFWIFHSRISKLKYIPKKFSSLSFQPNIALNLLLLSTVSFFFFGLGTYFTIMSLFYLPPRQLLEFTGFFSASFLIGYVSIITPMGFGIRELIMSGGLIGFLLQSVVGFASLYARLMLILAELIFLVIAFLFHKIKLLSSNKLIYHIRNHIHEYFLGLGVTLYSLYFTTASFLRYTNFFTGRFDLGNMDQTVWNTLHGRIFQLTDPNGTNIMSRLGTHADFLLALLSPFYLAWPDPRMLLLIQTLTLAIGAIFVYLIAKKVLNNKTLSLIIALSFLLNPSIQNSNLYDFHAVTLATTFFLGAWYFLGRKKYIWTFVMLVFAGLTKEEAWIVVGFFGIYISIFQNRRVLGLLTTVFSFGLFYLLVWKFIPLARGGQHFALSYYSDFGNTPTTVIKNIFLSPKIILKIIFEKSRIIYIYNLLFPVGFISLLAPQFLLFALPDLGINILSNNGQLREIFYQYTAIISPFLFIALIHGLSRAKKIFPKLDTFFYWYLIIFTFLGTYYLGPLPGTVHQNVDMFVKQQADNHEIEAFLRGIPRNLSVAATNNIGSHLSHRQLIYTVPIGIDKADVIVFLLNDPYAQPSLKTQKEMAEKLKHDKNYRLLFAKGDFIAFQRVTIKKPV